MFVRKEAAVAFQEFHIYLKSSSEKLSMDLLRVAEVDCSQNWP